MTLSDVLCDGNSLYVTYTVKSDEPFKYRAYEITEANNKITYIYLPAFKYVWLSLYLMSNSNKIEALSG